MNIVAGIIGMGIGEKHLEAIEGYKNSKIKIICEKNEKIIKLLKKKYPKIIITKNEDAIYLDKEINLVSIASYDEYHFKQIIKCFKFKKNIIVEKPMCLKESQLKKINILLKKQPNIKITSNLALRANSLFLNFRKNMNYKNIFYIEADYIWGRKEKLFEWRSKIKDYSITLGAAIHMIDLIMWLTKKRPINVTTFGNNLATKNTKFKKASLVIYLFEFPGRVIVKITANAAGIYNHFHEIKIFQRNKTLVNSYLGPYSFEKKNNKTLFTNLKHAYPDKKNRKELIKNFIDILIDKRTKPLVTLKEQFDLMSVCFAADKALKLKKKLNIKYL
jgi:predicted dehydrogenase